MIVYRMAIEKDLRNIHKLFNEATSNMYKKGIFQWESAYPGIEILKEDINKEQMFIGLKDGDIACAYVINRQWESVYENGHWKGKNFNCCVIHRLCVAPKYQNEGIGSQTLKHIEGQLRNWGIDSIRTDCYIMNPYARKMYEKSGYTAVGHADLKRGRFLLFEKEL